MTFIWHYWYYFNYRARPAPAVPQSPESFEPQRQNAGGSGRQRLQVTEIKVRPQLADEFADEPLDIDAFRRVANQFRQRGSQQ